MRAWTTTGVDARARARRRATSRVDARGRDDAMGRPRGRGRASASDGATPALASAELVVIANDGHEDARVVTTPGVYAMYDARGTLQYVGLSRRVRASVKTHAFEIPQYCHAVRCLAMPDASKAELQTAWKTWVMEHVAASGGLPPGNAPGNKLFSERRARPSKACVRLSDGKDPEMSAEALTEAIARCVKDHKVVAFIKGTREEPDCGFSHRVVNVLHDLSIDFDTVNVLDDYYNPNLLFVLKDFSDWPTIPQLYVNGEFVGGHDIVNSMYESGELKKLVGAA